VYQASKNTFSQTRSPEKKNQGSIAFYKTIETLKK